MYQVANWGFHTTTGLLHWRIAGFIPYIGIGLNVSIKIAIGKFFRPKYASSLNSIAVRSIYHFRATLTEKIALRLGLLFGSDSISQIETQLRSFQTNSKQCSKNFSW